MRGQSSGAYWPQVAAGLFFPRFSTVAGIIYIIGRIFYGIGYRSKGSKGRLVGVLLVDLALLSLFGVTVYAGYQHAGGCEAFIELFKETTKNPSTLFN